MPVSQDNLERLGHILGESIFTAKDFSVEERNKFIKQVIKAMVEHLLEKGLSHEEIDSIAVNIAENLRQMVAIDQVHIHILKEHNAKPPPG